MESVPNDGTLQAAIDEVLRANLRFSRTLEHIEPGLLLREDLGVNSIDLVEIMLDLEERLHVKVDDEALESCRTVNDLRILIAAAAQHG